MQKQINSEKFILKTINDTLILENIEEKTSINVDFCSNQSIKRINEPGILKQDLCKAIGFNKTKDLNILDCTAGLGRDSFIFASITTKSVTMLERNPTSFALLENGLKRLNLTNNPQLQKIAPKLSLLNKDALEYLENDLQEYDIIYLDPMFSGENQKKSAKVKKEMAFFKQTVGNDNDADKLLIKALKNAKKRVIVKRHIKAPYLNNTKPDIEFKGKTNRFDVYIII